MGISLGDHLMFLGVDDITKARQFYEGVLGIPFVADEHGTLVFDMAGTPLRISQVDGFQAQSFSVLGWNVADIDDATRELSKQGVEAVRYPGMPHDDNGVANLGGVRIVWFKDPAGNLLSFTQA